MYKCKIPVLLLVFAVFSGLVQAQEIQRSKGHFSGSLETNWGFYMKDDKLGVKKVEDKVRIIAVSIDDARAMAKVKSLVKGKKWPFEVLLDPNKELYKAFNISAIPHVLVINDKKVVWTHSGYMPGNEVLVVDKALETIGKK